MSKRISRRELLVALAGAASAGACARIKGWGRDTRRELVLCGGDEVFILSLGRRGEPATEKVWSWRAAECPNLPASLRPAFRSTDDCKPAAGGSRILISSSSGAVALVERQTRRALFWASVVNAHSIEILPGGRIVAAASVSDSLGGNRLVFFDAAAPEKELFSDSLPSAHGAVWDEARTALWALGGDVLRCYRWDARKEPGGGARRAPDPAAFTLETARVASFPLPDTGGHDLAPIPGTPRLFVSTGRHGWYFDRDILRFEPHETLADAANVKSYSVNRATGQIAYVQAEGGNWWAERVHFLHPDGLLQLPGQRLYKARWIDAAR